jgi:hypothetical protein
MTLKSGLRSSRTENSAQQNIKERRIKQTGGEGDHGWVGSLF